MSFNIIKKTCKLTQSFVFVVIVLLQCAYIVITVVFCQLQGDITNISQSTNISVINNIKSNQTQVCECMEYWSCAARNGQFYSYCGISDNEVCCYFERIQTLESKPELIDRNKTDNLLRSNNINDTIWSPPIIPNNAKSTKPCGIASILGNIDSVAEFREWPWHVAILEAKDDLYLCGGSLISPKHVLTAAHCVSSYLGRNPRLKIRAGEYDVSTNSEESPHVELLVKVVTLHPNYSNSSLVNDIAILELVRKISMRNRDNIALVCLPSQNQRNLTYPGRCIVTGWGRPNEQSDHSVRMKEIIVPVWETDQCEWKLRRRFGPSYNLPDTSLCAGDQGKDACDGDGGGPLVCFQNGKWIQHGIVSFGVGCGRAELPGVYTRVSSFVTWINKEMTIAT